MDFIEAEDEDGESNTWKAWIGVRTDTKNVPNLHLNQESSTLVIDN